MYRFVTALSVLLLALPVLADFDSGSDGSDGALNCATLGLTDCANTCTAETPCEVLISLGLATTASWDTPSPDPGKGVYDAEEWAVVYKYTTIDIPAFVTVTFANHPKGAPVVWLAMDDPKTINDVNIAGTVSLDGADGTIDPVSSYAIPGPGGFSGGIWRLGASAGFGPGGGNLSTGQASGGGYGTAGTPGSGPGGVIYGTSSIVPLIGGSGGGARPLSNSNFSGGAGGGAILIASSGNITLDSTGGIFAIGGNASGSVGGSGSGGGIRLVANQISGSGILRALGGTIGNDGGEGRIRVEANGNTLDDRGDPPFTIGPPGLVFPDPTTAPSLRVTAINSNPVPVDPLATVVSEDVAFTTDLPVTIDIEAQNVPVGLIVNVRIVQARGFTNTVVFSTPLEPAGEGITIATAEFTFPTGAWEVQLSVQLP